MMPNDPPIGGPPIALSPATFARHDEAARYVEGLIRTRDPREGSGRWPGAAPGAWGLLASGATITGGSGLTLGSGTVTLCDRAGTALKDPAETVTAYNGGGSISGPKVLPLRWTVGDWVVSGCFGGGATFSQTFLAGGCFGHAPVGATVSVYDSPGGTLLAQGLTDSSGHVSLSWSGASGSVYVTATPSASQPWLFTYAGSLTMVSGGISGLSMWPTTFHVTHCSGTVSITGLAAGIGPVTVPGVAVAGFGASGPCTYMGTTTGPTGLSMIAPCPTSATTWTVRLSYGVLGPFAGYTGPDATAPFVPISGVDCTGGGGPSPQVSGNVSVTLTGTIGPTSISVSGTIPAFGDEGYPVPCAGSTLTLTN